MKAAVVVSILAMSCTRVPHKEANTMDMVKRIAVVAPSHAETMGKRPTTFESVAVPFWSSFKLVRATVELPHKPLSLAFADNGDQLLGLAEPGDVYKVNGLEALKLTSNQVPAYLRFFVTHAEPGSRELVEKAAELEWLHSSETDPEQKQVRTAASSQIHPVKVTQNADGFTAIAIVLEQKTLLEVTYEVQQKGTVKLRESKELADNLPVPVVLN